MATLEARYEEAVFLMSCLFVRSIEEIDQMLDVLVCWNDTATLVESAVASFTDSYDDGFDSAAANFTEKLAQCRYEALLEDMGIDPEDASPLEGSEFPGTFERHEDWDEATYQEMQARFSIGENSPS